MRILMILISDTEPDYRDRDAPLQLARFVAPYYIFSDAGLDVALASREGGAPWTRPEAAAPQISSEIIRRFKADRAAREALNDTLSFDQIDITDFAAAFCIGAPGPIWQHPDPHSSASIIAKFLEHGRPVAVTAGTFDLTPFGARDGLLIIGESLEAPTLAAKALLAILRSGEPS
jgi:putative intracellular protease/amidase